MTYDSSDIDDTPVASSNIVPFIGGGAAISPRLEAGPQFHDAGMLPDGYLAKPDGIYFLSQDDHGDVQVMRICSPIEVVGICRRCNGKGWGRVVGVVDPDGRTHRLILDEILFNGAANALMRPLLDAGLQVEKSATARKLLVELLRAQPPQKTFLRASMTGWTDTNFDTFVLADGSIVGCNPTILERDTGSIGKAAIEKGSLDEWRETVAAACVGNPLMLLAVSQAFTGPLLAPLGVDGGGFHFRGASSRGKTTLLGVAASVWGAPKYVQSWRATDNALETVASCCSGALLALDELHQVSPQVAGETIYMLANGRGKQRMGRAGKAESTESWHVALLSSGEISLEDHMASGGKRIQAGQDIRLIDIAADGQVFGAFDHLHGETEARHFVERLQRAAANHHGHPGRLFVERFRSKIDRSDAYTSFVNEFLRLAVKIHDLDRDSQVQRSLKRFALAALAGEMATIFGLTGWKKGTALNGILAVAGAWIEDKGAIRKRDIDAALDRTRAHLTAHLESFAALGPIESVSGWRDDSFFYIRPDAWTQIHGADEAQGAARLHEAAGFLRTDRGKTLQLRLGRDIPGRPKVYAVSVALLKEQ